MDLAPVPIMTPHSEISLAEHGDIYSESYADQDDHLILYLDNFLIGNYYVDLTLYTLFKLLYGPMQVILGYKSIIFLTLYARIIHLGIDLIVTESKSNFVIKELVICSFGLAQLVMHFRESLAPEVQVQSFLFIITVIACLTLLSKLFQRFMLFKNASMIYVTMVLPIFLNEYMIYYKNLSHNLALRAIIMTLVMKATSDVYSDKCNQSSLFSSLSYLLHPASCLMGPWHRRQNSYFKRGTNRYHLRIFLSQLLVTLRYLMVAVFMLLISTNLPDLMETFNRFTDNKFALGIVKVYLTAQEFRFSHYFTCFLSSALIKLWDESGLQACNILKVEWPRSLVEVVTFWNIPMHQWLKKYVFSRLLAQGQQAASTIVTTYLVSSALHGFKFHIWAVLLTLGFATWIEHNLRKTLAAKYSACVLARDCRRNSEGICMRGHKYHRPSDLPVLSINSTFRLLSMLQLAYLGLIFEGNSDQANHNDALSIWSENYYFGHLLCISMLVTSYCF